MSVITFLSLRSTYFNVVAMLTENCYRVNDLIISSGFTTVQAQPVAQPDEFYTDQHVIGLIRLPSSSVIIYLWAM